MTAATYYYQRARKFVSGELTGSLDRVIARFYKIKLYRAMDDEAYDLCCDLKMGHRTLEAARACAGRKALAANARLAKVGQ